MEHAYESLIKTKLCDMRSNTFKDAIEFIKEKFNIHTSQSDQVRKAGNNIGKKEKEPKEKK